MNAIVEAARKTSRSYFASKGLETPEAQADEFLTRIRVWRSDGSWLSDRMIDTACRIIASSAFDIDDLAENHLHLPLAIESLSDFDKSAGCPVYGVAYFRPPEIVICERAERYLPFYRACVAHEVGHIILHGGTGRRDSMNYAPGASNRPPEEREADLFMTSLLAPKSVMILAVALSAVESDVHLTDAWRNANSTKGMWQWRERLFPCLIDRLCLSRHLLIVQMQRFGVFSNETAEYHKSYPLPNRWRTE